MFIYADKHGVEFSYSYDELKEEISNKRMALYNIYNEEKEHIGSFLVRIDVYAQCKELVIFGAGGISPKGVSILGIITEFCKELALKMDCKYVRAHTYTKSRLKLFERAGGKLCEYVARIEVGDHE